MSGIHAQGGSNRTIYDECKYKQWEHDTTDPFRYRMYEGNFENCGKCKFDNFYHPYDLVDIESELRNQTRPLSNCGSWKYNPNYAQNRCKIEKGEAEFEGLLPVEKKEEEEVEEEKIEKFTDMSKNCGKVIYGGKYKIPTCVPYNSKRPNYTNCRCNQPEQVETFVANPRVDIEKGVQSSRVKCCLNGVSTFDPSVPKVAPAGLCPIVFNNIPKRTCPGFSIPEYLEKCN